MSARHDDISQPEARRQDLDFDVLGEQIGFAAHRALLVLKRSFARQVAPIRPVAFNALVLIGANPGITQTDLATALFLDKGTTAHLVSKLQQRGWIERNSRSSDRRLKGVYLSPGGVQEVERLKREIRQLSERWATLFQPEERQQLLTLLNRIVAAGAPMPMARDPEDLGSQ
jgi:DNA-binding MarR family transcriptional regulator